MQFMFEFFIYIFFWEESNTLELCDRTEEYEISAFSCERGEHFSIN